MSRLYVLLLVSCLMWGCSRQPENAKNNDITLAECSQKIDELEQRLSELEQKGRAIQRRIGKGAGEEEVQQANKELQKIREECKALDMPLLRLKYLERKLEGKDLSEVRGGKAYFGILVRNDVSDEYILALLDEFPELARTEQRDIGYPVDVCSLHCNTNVLSALLRNGGQPSNLAFFNFVDWQRIYNPLPKRAHVYAQMLVDAGADINATDDTGRTPLHWLFDPHGDHLAKDIRERLIAERRVVNIAKTKGQTKRPPHTQLLDLLKTLGADFRIKDDSGFTPEGLIEKNNAEQEN